MYTLRGRLKKIRNSILTGAVEHGVIKRRGNTMKYKGLVWSNNLLDNGKSHTQREWIAFLEGTGWRLPTVKEYESLRGCKGKFMEDLREEMISEWLMTADSLTNPFIRKKRPVVLGLSVSNDWFSISAYVDYINRPARGVAVAPKEKGVLKKQ